MLAGRDDTPARSFMTKAELPSETLATWRSFAAVTDVAPLAPGHVLLVTKRHVLAINRLSPAALADLDAMRAGVAARLHSLYSLPVVAFEHGLCKAGAGPACGIDHAHLHVVPVEAALEKAFREDFEVVRLAKLTELREVTKRRSEYLLLITPSDEILIAFPQRAESQYFRRTLGQLTGREFWNWQDEVMLGQAARRREWILHLHRSWPGQDSLLEPLVGQVNDQESYRDDQPEA